jgi:hypothetical protein
MVLCTIFLILILSDWTSLCFPVRMTNYFQNGSLSSNYVSLLTPVSPQLGSLVTLFRKGSCYCYNERNFKYIKLMGQRKCDAIDVYLNELNEPDHIR